MYCVLYSLCKAFISCRFTIYTRKILVRLFISIYMYESQWHLSSHRYPYVTIYIRYRFLVNSSPSTFFISSTAYLHMHTVRRFPPRLAPRKFLSFSSLSHARPSSPKTFPIHWLTTYTQMVFNVRFPDETPEFPADEFVRAVLFCGRTSLPYSHRFVCAPYRNLILLCQPILNWIVSEVGSSSWSLESLFEQDSIDTQARQSNRVRLLGTEWNTWSRRVFHPLVWSFFCITFDPTQARFTDFIEPVFQTFSKYKLFSSTNLSRFSLARLHFHTVTTWRSPRSSPSCPSRRHCIPSRRPRQNCLAPQLHFLEKDGLWPQD